CRPPAARSLPGRPTASSSTASSTRRTTSAPSSRTARTGSSRPRGAAGSASHRTESHGRPGSVSPAGRLARIGEFTVTKRNATIVATALLCVALGAFAAPASIDRKLEGGSPSVDELVARFLDALGKKDAATLRRLRVTREEYLDIILPGTVPVGADRRRWRD